MNFCHSVIQPYFFLQILTVYFNLHRFTLQVATASMRNTFTNRHIWLWNEDQSNLDEINDSGSEEDKQVYRQHIDDLIALATRAHEVRK